MLRRGKILLQNVGTELEQYSIPVGSDWLKDVLLRAAPDQEIYEVSPEEWAEKGQMSAEISIEKIAGSEDFQLAGSLEARVPTYCARCLEEVLVERKGTFHLFLKLVERVREDEKDSGDPDLLYIDHPEFDLRDVLAEQLMVLEPFAEVPKADFQGKPHVCSLNLPLNSEVQGGQDASFEASSPFAKLAQLKGQLKQGDA